MPKYINEKEKPGVQNSAISSEHEFRTQAESSELKFGTKKESSKLKDPGVHARLAILIGEEKPYMWAVRMGISKGAFFRIWELGTVPNPINLRRIRKKAGVSIDWLLTGEGPMRSSDKGTVNEHGAAHAAQLLEELMFIPIYGIEAPAGDEKAAKTLAVRRDWLKQQGFYSDRLAVVIAQGDSMEPTIREGDVLLVDTQQKEPLLDTIYIMSRKELVFAKRLQERQDGSVVIRSDNEIYNPEVVSAKDAGSLRIVGRVVWIGRRL